MSYFRYVCLPADDAEVTGREPANFDDQELAAPGSDPDSETYTEDKVISISSNTGPQEPRLTTNRNSQHSPLPSFFSHSDHSAIFSDADTAPYEPAATVQNENPRVTAANEYHRAIGTAMRPLPPFPPILPSLKGHDLRESTYDPHQARHVTQLYIAAEYRTKYRSNFWIAAQESSHIPEELNCSLFITGLPPTVTVRDLLRGIRDIGRVYALHIIQPQPRRGHTTCAAGITFFDRDGAEGFFDHFGGRRHGVSLPDYPGWVATVVWNHIRAFPRSEPAHYTRVLIITGPRHLVKPQFLLDFFASKFRFEVEVIHHGSDGDVSKVEFQFGSYRCQAKSARAALERELGDQVQVCFGRDPCDARHTATRDY